MNEPQPWSKEIPEVDEFIRYYKRSVSKFMYDARSKICQSCEFFSNGFCLQCGCKLDIKLINAEEQCPIHKW